MAAYNVTLKPSVEKDLRALHPTIRARVLERIAQLQEEPLPRQASNWREKSSGIGFVSEIIALSTGLIGTPCRSPYTMCAIVAMSIAGCKILAEVV